MGESNSKRTAKALKFISFFIFLFFVFCFVWFLFFAVGCFDFVVPGLLFFLYNRL